MSNSTACRKCGTTIQVSTAESTGGFCKPCHRWFLTTSHDKNFIVPDWIERSKRQVAVVQDQVLAKTGVTQDDLYRDAYKVLNGFLSTFVRLDFRATIPEMLVRCRNEIRERLQSESLPVKKSERMRWTDLDGWDWTDVQLDGSVDSETLKDLVDDSYNLTCNSLGESDRMCLSLLSRDLEPAVLFDELLKSFGMLRRREKIVAAKTPAFLLTTETADLEQLPLGSSRLGGLPDLPADVQWPHYKNGQPLAFLAQINLADLPSSTALPEQGFLWFFSVFGWQIEDESDPQLPSGKYSQDWTKVIYQDVATDQLQRSDPPTNVNLFEPARVQFVPFDCYPSAPKEKAIAQFKWKSDIKDNYESLIATYNMTVMQRLGNPARSLLLGYADFEQDFVRRVAKDDMRLVFQLGSDSNARMCWGDGGYLYFWVPANDLEQCKFDNVLTDYQCG